MTVTPVPTFTPPAEPTAAERVRSLLLAESSLSVGIDGHRAHLIGRHRVDEHGRLLLELPLGSCLATTVKADPDGVVATVEITDVAATAMRSRVRAQVTMTGWLAEVSGGCDDGEMLAQLHIASIDMVTEDAVHQVEPDDFTAARPDPLAADERTLLCHLVDAHPATVDRLVELVQPLLLHGVRKVHALRLDRYGIVLRLEYASRDRDVRLTFAEPLTGPDQAPARLLELLSRPPACRRRR